MTKKDRVAIVFTIPFLVLAIIVTIGGAPAM